MPDSELRRVQLLELDILRDFIRVCEGNRLRYYAVGGTLLGAVRHKGFIPWDDDMDLAMPRKDYDKFLEVYRTCLSERYDVEHFSIQEDVYFYPMKLRDTKTRVSEKRLSEDDISFLSIDVFPIDGYPDRRFDQFRYKIGYYFRKMRIGFCNVNRLRKIDRPMHEKALIAFAKLFRLNEKLSLRKEQEGFDKVFKSTKGKKCKLVGDISGRYGFREFVPVSYFGKPVQLPFEDIMINAPKEYDKYLSRIYGDYMQLPPEDKRVSDHIRIVGDEAGKQADGSDER